MPSVYFIINQLKTENTRIFHLLVYKQKSGIQRTHIYWPRKTEVLRKLKFLHIKISDSRIIIRSSEMNCTTENFEICSIMFTEGKMYKYLLTKRE